jgi:uncharacterized membrane protein YhdT
MLTVYQATMKKNWDKWGIGLSSLCLVHCIGMALLPLVLPASQHFDLWFHVAVAVLVLVTSIKAFRPSYLKRGWLPPHTLAIAGLSLISLGLSLELTNFHPWSHASTMAGSLTLVTAHLWNLKLST